MLKLIKGWMAEPPEEVGLTPELAAAALLFEVVWADHAIEAHEVDLMSTQLQQCFDIPEAQLAELTQSAKTLHDDAVGLHEFTRTLNDHLGQEEKYAVILAMWRVAFADHQLDPLEEHMIRRAADLLYVSHKDFIAAKRTAREAMS